MYLFFSLEMNVFFSWESYFRRKKIVCMQFYKNKLYMTKCFLVAIQHAYNSYLGWIHVWNWNQIVLRNVYHHNYKRILVEFSLDFLFCFYTYLLFHFKNICTTPRITPLTKNPNNPKQKKLILGKQNKRGEINENFF